MKVGDVIGGYVLTTNASTAGGGQSQWAFALRGGTEYFLKQFLAPTHPTPDGPGSEEIKARKLERCEAFEAQHRAVTSRLKPISGDGGNLVITKDFFLHGTHYYKVTEKIDISGLEPEDIARMDVSSRLLVMLTAVHSIGTLHVAGLVHGDIKPPNVLIKSVRDNFLAKIIDFDNCFVAHMPPPPADLVGDPVYYSPELMRYILDGSQPEQLSAKADVFALGVVFWQYATGSLPALPAKYPYPAQAVAAGKMPTPPLPSEKDPIRLLIASMLSLEPENRPSMKEIHNTLKRIRRYGTAEPIIDAGRRTVGILRGSLWISHGSRRDGSDDSSAPDVPRLRGSLVKGGESADAAGAEERKLRGSLLKKKP